MTDTPDTPMNIHAGLLDLHNDIYRASHEVITDTLWTSDVPGMTVIDRITYMTQALTQAWGIIEAEHLRHATNHDNSKDPLDLGARTALEHLRDLLRPTLADTSPHGHFECAHCHSIWEKGWSDEEAAKEFVTLYGSEPTPEDKEGALCDDCSPRFQEYLEKIGVKPGDVAP